MILSIRTGQPIEAQQKVGKRKKRGSFLHRAQHLVEQLCGQRRASTIDNYRTALRSLARFLHDEGNQEVVLTRRIVEHYDLWLAREGVSANTRSCYLRSLRALHRRLVGRGRESDAFSTVFTGNAPTRKRALSLRSLHQLRALDVEDDDGLCLARDVFFFSLFALGMPFADVAQLRWRDLRGGYFVYHRRKTGAEVRVRLESCMMEIVHRWRRRRSDFVFPLLAEGIEGKAAQRVYRAALTLYNRRLHRLAVRAQLHLPLSSYCARHTWATMAYSQGMNLQLIATAMGHRSAQTTMVYIAKREYIRVARENKKVLERICGNLIGEHLSSRRDADTYCKEVKQRR